MNAIFNKRHKALFFLAIATTLADVQPLEAAVVHIDVDVDVPPTYEVDLGNDGVVEFDVARSQVCIIGCTDYFRFGAFGEGVGIIDEREHPNSVVAEGAWIDSSYSYHVPAPLFASFLDEPGYIGVEFQLAGNTHYGYVGYETGHVFALGWNDTPGEGIRAGGVPEPSSLMLAGASLAAALLGQRRRSN